MAKGLGLSILKLIATNQYQITYPSVKNIRVVEGVTLLAESFMWFILSNKFENVGSHLRRLLLAPLNFEGNLEVVSLYITDELADATNRFKIYQSRQANLETEELLETANVLKVTTDPVAASVRAQIEIINQLGNRVGLETP